MTLGRLLLSRKVLLNSSFSGQGQAFLGYIVRILTAVALGRDNRTTIVEKALTDRCCRVQEAVVRTMS